MKKQNISVGKFGEDLAAQYLADAGYEVIDRNWKCKLGELDIICKLKQGREKILVFVEVKTKGGAGWGSPEEMVDKRKQQKLILVAQEYLRQHQLKKAAFRFDIVAVEFNPLSGLPMITLIPSAIEG